MENLKSLTDEQVVKLILTKDQEFYRELVDRYQNKLLRYARYLTYSETKAADVVQEAFVKAFINLNSFNIKMKFSTWIYRIVHNEAINILTKHPKELKVPEGVDFDSGINLENDLTEKEIKEKVEQCLSQMPIIYSEPLSLFFLEEKSYIEISDILRLSISTVGTRINRAKIIMKKICQKT